MSVLKVHFGNQANDQMAATKTTQDTFSCRWDRMSVLKVHFGNQANDQMAATKSTDGKTQPDLINYINNHLGVDFDTLQVKVAVRKKDQEISQGTHSHFQCSKHLPPSGGTAAHPGDATLCQMTTLCLIIH
jgi:hypothetical protein